MLSTVLFLAFAGISTTQGIDNTLSFMTFWQYLIVFTYAMGHKLGVVSIGLALTHFFMPHHWPKPILTVMAGFVFALAYNFVQLFIYFDGAILEQISISQLFQDYLIYYGLAGMLIGLLGSIFCKRLLR